MRSVLSGASVLVADPDPDACPLYAFSLGIPEERVTQAFDGRDALVKALERPVSLLITETHLPMIDGYALCEVLRHDGATRQLPILVVTGDGRVTALERALAAGADSVVVKPFDPETLRTEARRVVDRSLDLREKSSRLLITAAERVARADAVRERSRARRKLDQYVRFETTNPLTAPPVLRCPLCDGPLTYVSTQIGGVSDAFAERWDYYACRPACGRFQYRC